MPGWYGGAPLSGTGLKLPKYAGPGTYGCGGSAAGTGRAPFAAGPITSMPLP